MSGITIAIDKSLGDYGGGADYLVPNLELEDNFNYLLETGGLILLEVGT